MSIIRPTSRLATEKQINYIRDLFDALGFSGMQRRDWLGEGYKKRYEDELTIDEASSVIDTLKARVEQQEIDRQGKLKL